MNPAVAIMMTLGLTSASLGDPGGEFLERVYEGEHGSRLYRLYVPDGYDGTPAPLLVMLHGCTQDAADFARGTRMNELAEKHGVLVAYPEQPASAQPLKCWSWYETAHQHRDAGEPGILAGITREVLRDYQIDPERVYVAGVSAGGAMALILAATYPDLYAAVGVHSAVTFGIVDSTPAALRAMQGDVPRDAEQLAALVRRVMGEHARPIPVIALHGAADPTVRPANLDAIAVQWSAANAGLAGLATPTAPLVDHGEAGGLRYRRARFGDGVIVETWLIEELAHAWSGGDPAGTYAEPRGPDASAVLLRFLLAQRLQR
jgi:poly(hydroxyalkanoate) depolymerase family esterase